MKPIFNELTIKDVYIARVEIYTDHRGWLIETFREDWLKYRPVMSYISMTNPNMARGPHEHRRQTDYIVFLGISQFKVFLWDNRSDSPTYNVHLQLYMNESEPSLLIIPPGVVHGYKNLGSKPGLVLNYPDRLYRGLDRLESVDEIRYEDNRNSRFKIE